MKRKRRRVAIVGSGMVGSSCAYSMINQSICDEIIMIGRTYDRALAQALDLSHCIDFTHTRTSIYAGTYADCADVDVVIITAGVNPKPGQNRMDVLAEAAEITKQIVIPIVESGFEGIFITAANPVDIVTQMVWKLTGFPRHRVIGTGTSIDTSRLKTLLSDVFSIDPRSVSGYALGEHGESQFVAWSHVTIGGKPILDILAQHPERFKHLDLDDIARKTKDAGWEIFTRKGSTHFGIGSAIAHITRAVLNDEHKIIAVSAILDGEYGQYDVCAGVPAIINSEGIQELVELKLNEEETKLFNNSCDLIRRNMAGLALEPVQAQGV
ncbi:L-lactate dehydrogenase [Paenibacillus sp.]|uniref:L-lactate dehydrogenase n=1 Tax=Paenibacillus sp. TaxID=58172 RepID=UPI00281915B1|nr:L-lactate dehydrogenase [Paenibacillus sp.]MDR0270755.1 L-lactate dehydrogenase [Paenibacillus sp.]